MKTMYLSALAVLIMMGAAGQESAPAPPPTTIRVSQPEASNPVEVVFEPAVFDLFKEWLANKTVDELRVEMQVPAYNRPVVEWIETLLAGNVEPKKYGSKIVITLPEGPAIGGSGPPLSYCLALFNDQVLRKAESDAQLEESKQRDAEEAAKAERVEQLEAQLRQLDLASIAELGGRDSAQLKEEVNRLAQETSDMSLKRVELDARVKAIQDRLAQEEPVIPLKQSADDDALEALKSALSDQKRALDEKQQLVETGRLSKGELAQHRAAVAYGELLLKSAGPERETVNPVYVRLKEMLVDAETELAGVTARLEALKALQAARTEMLKAAQETESQKQGIQKEIGRASRPAPPAPPRPLVRPSGETEYKFPVPAIIR